MGTTWVVRTAEMTVTVLESSTVSGGSVMVLDTTRVAVTVAGTVTVVGTIRVMGLPAAVVVYTIVVETIRVAVPAVLTAVTVAVRIKVVEMVERTVLGVVTVAVWIRDVTAVRVTDTVRVLVTG